MAEPTPVTVVALPGFTRRPEHLQRLAEACAAAGLACVRPVTAPRWMPALYMSRSRIQAIADRLVHGGVAAAVLVGHSAGGSVACFLAQCLRDRGVTVRGVVLVDAVDSPNRLIAHSLPQLRDIPVSAVLAPPSPCNRHGRLAEALRAFPWVDVTVIEGAGHGDIEGAGQAVYRRACGDASDSGTAERVLAAVMKEVCLDASSATGTG